MKALNLVILFTLSWTGVNARPIQLHPENPHYLLFKGQPTILVTSAEHYGAVLNLDFDYETYLQTLHAEGMNYTRIFTGSYVEVPGNFNIGNNTLAPAEGRYITPWHEVGEAGNYPGENKYDLSQWNPAYFQRLHGFMSLARDLDIIVEVTLFCSTYKDLQWNRNPFNPGNNVNGISPDLDRKQSNTLANGKLTGFQKALAEKLARELNSYDNMFFEIQNEPWSDDPQKVMRTLPTLNPKPGEGDWFKWAETGSEASMEWQKAIAQVIVDTEKELPNKHLIAQNYTNFKYAVDAVDPNISILNFHYAWPDAVWLNYGWNFPISFDESGFDGTDTDTYLRQAWQFMMAGGAVFNNLDYSFAVGAEDGTLTENDAPGAGSPAFRKQLHLLRGFLESFDFISMRPDFNVVAHSPGCQVQALSEPGKQYAMVLTGVASDWLKLDLPAGAYDYTFLDPYSGKTVKQGSFRQPRDEVLRLDVPAFERMIALGIRRTAR